MKELTLPSSCCAPHSFPAASTRALISHLVPAAPTTAVTEQQETYSTIGHDLEEELRLQQGEQLRQAPSARELQLQQLTAVAVAAVHNLKEQEC